MQIAHLTRTFPKISKTFILNQLVGLVRAGHGVEVFATGQPDTPVEHASISEYNLFENIVYTESPDTYLEGVKILLDVVPGLISEGYGTRSVLSQLRYGTDAPVRLGNVRAFSQQNIEADVIHAHFGTTGNAYLPAVELTQLPLVVSFYGYDVSSIPRTNPTVYDDLFERADAITCLSEDMRSDIRALGVSKHKIRRIPLCIDTETFRHTGASKDTDEPVRVLTVARHVEKKGLEYALKAIAKLEFDQELRYAIAGDGPLRPELERLIQTLDIEETVDLLGWQTQEEIAQLLADSHLFVLPSITATDGDKEGTPTVLLEAQAAGLPVISTTHAGIPEIVSNGETGILVPEKDVTALADALKTLITQPKKWHAMGREGRRYVEKNHSIDAVTDRLVGTYRNVE
jgi:colanic acid/amylovoran biosynthesis glycosyltransferase